MFHSFQFILIDTNRSLAFVVRQDLFDKICCSTIIVCRDLSRRVRVRFRREGEDLFRRQNFLSFLRRRRCRLRQLLRRSMKTRIDFVSL